MFKELNAQSNLPKIEKKILDFWEKNGIFEKSIKIRDRENSFVFYEGPPTANGRPGIHHVISRTIKDFFCRYKAMNGYYVPRKAGWDTHGLPVEIEIEKKLNITNKEQILEFGVENFNRECLESVLKYTREWEDLTKRIGFWVNLEEAYLTYSNDYIESVWWIIKQFYDAGLIYKDYKVLPYCPRCGTPLSSHEVAQGYKNVTEKSVYVRFRLKDQSNHFILAWTTTPWTLPGNVALAVGSDIDYIKVKQTLPDGSNEFLYLAKDLSELIVGDYEIVEHLKGHEMAGWKYEPLFQSIPDQNVEKAWFIAEADFVTTNEGTGIVHTAVMYGEDDYELGSRLGLPRHHTVDENGRFTSDVKEFEGIFVKDAEKNIIKNLRDRGLLYLSSDYTHSYPHCWRCDSPLLYYARDSWYLKTTAFKDKLVDINDTINWYPKEVGEKRFGKWLGNNIDWALSRDRFWGTPLNIWICVSCGETDCIGSVEELRKKSTNVPQNLDLHKPFVDDIITSCKQCGENMERTPEVLDAWFDSGSMPYAQWHYPFENEELFKERFPADFISEGIDQTRGWFYSLHVIASFLFGKMAYKNCVSIELILDKDGQKMSKSKGNVVNPFKILDKFGADTLRWYLLTVNQPWVPLRFDEDGLLEVQRKFFGTLINTYSFFAMYANIDNFDVNADQVSLLKRSELDRWIISRLNTVISQINDHLTRYDPTRAGRIISNFVIDDLSNWYIRRSRRRFWKEEMGDDKLSAYQTLYEVLTTVAHLIAPFAPFIADSIYKNLTSTKKGASESVHLADYPKFDASKINENLETEMYLSQTIVGLARSLRNTSQIKVRQPLKKLIVVTKSKEQIKAIRKMEILIKEEINVHTIEFIEDETLLITKKGKPNFKTIGPKFGKNAKLIAEAIRSFNAETIASLEKMETIDVKLGDKTYTVEFSDVEIIEEEMEEVQMGIDKDITIALDTHITAELQKEGFAREFVNRVQNMRKEAEFEVTDRIRVFFQSGLKLKEAIEFKKQYIQKEILAAEISDTFHKGEYSKEWKVNSESVNIGIERVV